MNMPHPKILWIIIKLLVVTSITLSYGLFVPFTKNKRQKADDCSRFWSKHFLDYARVSTHTTGSPIEYEPGKAYIIMSNHASLFDIPLVFNGLPGSIRMLAKKELSRIPIFGYVLAQNEFIYVDRRNRERAKEDLKRAQQLMEDGIVLWVSPEGTRSLDGKILPFKKGVFHLAIDTKATIIPVGIRGAYDVLPSKAIFSLKTDKEVVLEAGAPIDCSELTKDDRDKLIKQTRNTILELCQQQDCY